ncbi:MAG TPA: hypothetical protein VLQ93_09935, partial [Myxococcaceae bacterium]|nr:hypothetical protein [Myxococcaceae bacterium]
LAVGLSLRGGEPPEALPEQRHVAERSPVGTLPPAAPVAAPPKVRRPSPPPPPPPPPRPPPAAPVEVA